ncbi:MAG TPA: peptide MFS transporter [Alphaproteobacteria bacterium]|nr:peptide MFS transporter [Alphaproteobacteria bacterium]
MAVDTVSGSTTRKDRTFLGHPVGLAYLSFAEAWERFSYYGMQALLVLYMTQQLLLPGHVENVAGFAPFRAAIEHIYGPLSPEALASAIFGLYAGGVYLTPLAGGLIADRLLGRTATVTIGAGLMALGHFLMAFEGSFLAALACLLIGVGCFKGNIASQVGELYAPGDLRRADAFQIYMLGIQIAVIVSPLVCGTLGQKVAWHWGFGAAGVGMVFGLIIYLAGRRYLPRETIRPRAARAPREKLLAHEIKAVAVLILVIPILAATALGNQEMFNAYMVWGDAHFDLEFFGEKQPVTWLISLDAILSTITMVASVAFWRWWATLRREPDEVYKIGIGALIGALGPLALALAAMKETATGTKIGLGWAVAFHIFNDLGFANVFPVGLALFSRASPRAIAGLMIGVYYLHLFLSNMVVGWLGGLLETMSAMSFWLLHAALVGGAGGLMLLFGVAFGRLLAPQSEEERG